jgi:hypothetical protein
LKLVADWLTGAQDEHQFLPPAIASRNMAIFASIYLRRSMILCVSLLFRTIAARLHLRINDESHADSFATILSRPPTPHCPFMA